MIDFTLQDDNKTLDPEYAEPVFEIVKIGDWQSQIEQARKTFDAHKVELDRMVEDAGALVVKNQATEMQCTEMGTQAQGLIKKIELARKKIIEEPSDFVTRVNNLARIYREPLENIKIDLGAKRDRWLAEERRKQAEAEALARKEAAELQERLNREAKERAEAEAKARAEAEAAEKGVAVETIEVKVEPVPEIVIPDPILPQASATVRAGSGSGTAFQKTEWTFDVLDLKQVPLEFIMLNESEVKRQIKLGIREIPGLKIFERAKSQFRSR